MLRLNASQKAALGESLRELANLAAAVLVLGRFVSDQRLSWSSVFLGIAIWASLTTVAVWLLRENTNE
jgi:hypothetical protein